MTLSNNYLPVTQQGNGVTQDFAATWNGISEDYILVYSQNRATSILTPLNLGSDFTFNNFTDTGFSVHIVGGPPTNLVNIILARQTDLDQEDAYTTSRGFQGAVQEASFDKLTAITQELQEQINRSLKLPIGTNLDLSLPAPNAGKGLLWNPSGTGLINSNDNFNDIVTLATAQAVIATTQAGNAAASASTAELALDQFTDIYLGAKSTDPTLDNDGNALITGAIYFNTVSNKMRNYNGVSWSDVSPTSLISDGNKGDVTVSGSGTIWKTTPGTQIPANFTDQLFFANGQCRLSKSGLNLLLSPYNGNKIIINGSVQTIPNGGVTLAPTTVASTFYLIYAFMSGATMTLEASTTGHSTNTNGVEIKTGDATRTLVGAAWSSATNTWGTNNLHVINWFNRRALNQNTAFQAAGRTSTTAAGAVEINTEIRNDFLTWGDTSCAFAYSGGGNNNVVGGGINTTITADGIVNILAGTSYQQSSSGGGNFCVSGNQTLSEGRHFATILGQVSGTSATGTWFGTGTVLGSGILYVTIQG